MTFILLVLLLAPPGALQARATTGMKKKGQEVNCNIQERACTREIAGLTVTLNILPKPVRAMEDLLFQIHLSQKIPAGLPFIDLSMPGMRMGPNRVKLTAVGSNTYEGMGVVVRCPSGRTLWRATVTIPQTGSTEFIFHVVH